MHRAWRLPILAAWGVAVACASAKAGETYHWRSSDIDRARAQGKPILLYVYENLKSNGFQNEFDRFILPNEGVRAAFTEFLHIRILAGDRGWPADLTESGRKGAALYVLTCDAKTVALFGPGSMPNAVKQAGKPTYPQLVAAAQQTLKLNPQALADMKKNPPARFVPPGEQKPDPEEETAAADSLISMVGGGSEKAAPKKASARPEQQRKKPSDENE